MFHPQDDLTFDTVVAPGMVRVEARPSMRTNHSLPRIFASR